MTTTTSTGSPFSPDYIVPPGEPLLDLLDEREMTQTDLARRLGVSAKHVNQIVKGSAPMSADVALGLEKSSEDQCPSGPLAGALSSADGGPSPKQRTGRRPRLGDAVPDQGTQSSQRDPQAGNRRISSRAPASVSGIAHPDQWVDPTIAYRKTRAFESDKFALAAWLRVGELEATRIECAPYDHERFLDALDEIRPLTRLEPSDWQPEVARLCAAAGVAVVIVPHFSEARENGATQWISPTKAIIQLSLRYKWEDIFWFSFFHEAGHVVLHRKKTCSSNRPSRTRALTPPTQ